VLKAIIMKEFETIEFKRKNFDVRAKLIGFFKKNKVRSSYWPMYKIVDELLYNYDIKIKDNEKAI